jgi:hypothetical protein
VTELSKKTYSNSSPALVGHGGGGTPNRNKVSHQEFIESSSGLSGLSGKRSPKKEKEENGDEGVKRNGNLQVTISPFQEIVAMKRNSPIMKSDASKQSAYEEETKSDASGGGGEHKKSSEPSPSRRSRSSQRKRTPKNKDSSDSVSTLVCTTTTTTSIPSISLSLSSYSLLFCLPFFLL